jgi:FAD:protein FMN transferase
MSIAFVVTAPVPAAPVGQWSSSVRLDRTDDVEPPLRSAVADLMGGRVGVYLRPVDGGMTATSEADRSARSTLRRLAAWADRLTRFTDTSDLSRLNDAPTLRVPIRPTLAAALDWARMAEGLTDGIVDVAMLDARLAAERAEQATSTGSPIDRTWSMDRGRRETHVRRTVGLRLDLDGVAKGWLADRALGRLDPYPAAVVDADGDVAIRLGRGQRWKVGVADPRTAGQNLLELDLIGSDRHGGRRFGVATSGTSVHRWLHDGRVAHHLIDPRTGISAATDIVQATVLARTAREAEALAKTAVILGSDAALELLGRPGVDGAILLTEGDELLLTPSTMRWLA